MYRLRRTSPQMCLSFLFPCLLGLLQIGCTQLGTAAAGASAAASSGARLAPPKLMLFGGDGHKTYLGCLNCGEYATDSTFNEYGQSGSRLSSASIWNTYGDFGSAYSSYSVCNPYASDPPVIVDHEGNYYGRLTVNEYHAEIGGGRQYVAWLKQKVCA
jgi:hypothetical protein